MATTKNSYFLQFTVDHPRIGGGTLVLFWSLKVEDSTTPDQIMETLYGQCVTIVRKQTGITVDWTNINITAMSLLDSRVT